MFSGARYITIIMDMFSYIVSPLQMWSMCVPRVLPKLFPELSKIVFFSCRCFYSLLASQYFP